MNYNIDTWQATYLWNLLNEELGKLIEDGRPAEVTEKVVDLMNKLDEDYS